MATREVGDLIAERVIAHDGVERLQGDRTAATDDDAPATRRAHAEVASEVLVVTKVTMPA